LGAKLAAPEKTVICTVGDGSYIFGAPLAAHWVARAHNLPVLFVIFNNRAWNAVKRSVKAYAPEGWSVRTGVMPLSELDPAPDYEPVASAWGLLRNSRWSQYMIYVIAAMLAISWAVGVWRLTAEGWVRDHPGDAVLALVPGALSVVASAAIILAVFKHFHRSRTEVTR